MQRFDGIYTPTMREARAAREEREYNAHRFSWLELSIVLGLGIIATFNGLII